jgi:hypothetical protein
VAAPASKSCPPNDFPKVHDCGKNN